MTIDFREGARRIRVIGNWMMLVGASFFVIGEVGAAVRSPSRFLDTPVAYSVLGIVVSLFPGVMIRLLAWVVDGLGGRSKSEQAKPAGSAE
jgi:hypothetical protein